MSERLLAGLPPRGALSLGGHLEVHGRLPELIRLDSDGFIKVVQASGLRGRGGASFPAAIKMAAVAAGRNPVVVVNGTEGEPMSAKDRVLLELTPHLVLDGATVAAQAVGARQCVLVTPAATHPALEKAIAARKDLPRSGVRFKLRPAAEGYVAGEETAVLAHLEGRPPKPRVTPPRPAERGLRGRPTLVQNVETLAHLALIARHGADWFSSVGSAERPGTTLVTISGAVEAPGVYEVPTGQSLPALAKTAGGLTEQVRGMLVGGYFGGWVDGMGAGLRLDDESLRPVGAISGAGVVVALGESRCPVAETARLAAWLSSESAGQCGPCVHGLSGLADLVARAADGRRLKGDKERLARWSAMISGRGACHHPDGVARMIATAARTFAPEFKDHARHGRCHACTQQRVLATPARTARAA